MNCQEAQAAAVDLLSGALEPAGVARVAAHLEACPACRAEAEDLRDLWGALGRLGEQLPGPGLRTRFYAALGEAGGGTSPRRRDRSNWRAWLDSPRPACAALVPRLAWAAAALAAGTLLGFGLGRRGAESGEMYALRREVASLNQMVTLSMLQLDSASERLRAVSLARGAAESDQRIADALLETVMRDPNVNVRLAALDALDALADRPAVAAELLAALPGQPSPLVQIALVDLLLEAGGPTTRQALTALADEERLDPAVRGHLRRRLEQRT